MMEKISTDDIIAIVPMRKGSKGCPNKNIADLGGKPLFLYSLLFANNLGIKALISSDYDRSLIHPFIKNNLFLLRDSKFATDEALIEDVLLDVFEKKIIKNYKYCLLLQPTSPLRSIDTFNSLICSFLENGKSGLSLTVKELENNALKSGVIQDGKLININNNNKKFFQNRQFMPKLFSPDGCMYFFSIKEFCETGGFPCNSITPIKNDIIPSVDVDTSEDLSQLRLQIKEFLNKDGFQWMS